MTDDREVLYSPGFGAGWATWNSDNLFEFMTTYRPIIDFINGGGKFTDDDANSFGPYRHGREPHPLLVKMNDDARAAGLIDADDHLCVLGADDLRVATVSGRFRIKEYDGYESIVEEASEVWH